MTWTPEELQLLMELRESYGKNCWEKIAKDLNSSSIVRAIKTGTQCRDKYRNCSKFEQGRKENQNWTEDENKKLFQLYMVHGSSWSNFESSFPNKSVSSIKNKFYNNIRRIGRELMNFEKINFKYCRNPLTCENLLAVLQLSTRLRQWIAENDYKESQKSKILSKSKEILFKTFMEEGQMDQKFMRDIIVDFKCFNFKLKCLGIYKADQRKGWQLSKRRLGFILKTDNLIENQQELFSDFLEKNQSQNKSVQSTELFLNSNQWDLESLDLQQQDRFLRIQRIYDEFLEKEESCLFRKSSMDFLFPPDEQF